MTEFNMRRESWGGGRNPRKSAVSNGIRTHRNFRIVAPLLLLSACSSPTVLSTPNSCASLLPQEWKQGVAGAPLPDGETVGDWVAFADQQTGKLDQANERTTASIGIVERCEERDRKAVEKATRPWWKIF